jgi:hypothetical protein
MIAHPEARIIIQEPQATIHYHLDENIPPRQIISLIKKSDHTILITPMDIYNLRKSFLREQLAGRTSIHYLQDQLLTRQWKFAFEQDREGCITFFMFASPQGIQYANQYNRVVYLFSTAHIK